MAAAVLAAGLTSPLGLQPLRTLGQPAAASSSQRPASFFPPAVRDDLVLSMTHCNGPAPPLLISRRTNMVPSNQLLRLMHIWLLYDTRPACCCLLAAPHGPDGHCVPSYVMPTYSHRSGLFTECNQPSPVHQWSQSFSSPPLRRLQD